MGKATDWPELQALFERYRAGDAACARPLFTVLERVIEAFFRGRLQARQDAEDLAQATLLKIHFARDRFNANKALKTWVFTIASRCLIDHWRGRARQEELVESEEEFNEIPSEDPSLALRSDQRQDLVAALEILKPIDRDVVYLYGVEGFSMAEVGEILNLTESAAKLRAHRSYSKLRNKLGEKA